MDVLSTIYGTPLFALASTDPVTAAVESRGMVLATLVVLTLMIFLEKCSDGGVLE